MSEQPEEHVDLVVIGVGPGGEGLVTGAAQAGLRVVAIDRHLVGGECPYYGCIPSKMMVRGSDVLAEAARAGRLAGDVDVAPSWAPVATRIAEQATDHWDDTVAVERLQRAGVVVEHGTGRLAGPRRVTLERPDGTPGPTYVASRGVVLDVGTRPARPPISGLEGTPYWTNREVVQATERPGSLAVIGGGAIGCELAQVFSRFGTEVTIVQHGERLMPADEPEASALVEDVFARDGIRVMTGRETEAVSYADGLFELRMDDGSRVSAEKLLVAVGRTSNLDGVGLETVGLDPAARSLEVDERLRAGEGLWAIGDITGEGAFTHVSTYQADIALRDVLDQDGPPASYHAVPHVTFTDPEVGGVGMTEQQARDAGFSVRTGSTRLEDSSRGLTHGLGSRGLVKVVEDAERGVLVGACVVGPYGGEVLGLLALAVHAEVPVSTLETMILAYPTFHRAVASALADLG